MTEAVAPLRRAAIFVPLLDAALLTWAHTRGDASVALPRSRAAIIIDELRAELTKFFPMPAEPQADASPVQMRILGANQTKGAVATATRVTLLGFASSAVKSALGQARLVHRMGSRRGRTIGSQDKRTATCRGAALVARPAGRAGYFSTTDTEKAAERNLTKSGRTHLETLTGTERR